MAETVIEWDGRNVPRELRVLAPGRYLLSPLDSDDLTPEEDAAVSEGLDELEAGKGIPLAEVVQDLESRFRRS